MMWRAASELVTCDGMGSVTVQRLFRLCFFSRQQRASEVGLSLVGSGMYGRGRAWRGGAAGGGGVERKDEGGSGLLGWGAGGC